MRAFVAILFMLATGCATRPHLGDSVDAPIPTTITAVKAAPAEYHHKFVALRGLIDACTPWGCSLLPVTPGTIPAKDAGFIDGIQFDFLPEPGSPAGQAGDDFVDRSAELLERLYRFTEVTLVGRYDAKCSLGYDPDDLAAKAKQHDEIDICLDHHGDLKVHRILTVHKRWPATAGALWGYKQTALVPVPPDLAEGLYGSFKEAAVTANPDLDEWDSEHRAFVDPKQPDRTALCICRAKSCDGKWPATTDDLVPAPANPYQCTVGIRTKTGWRFPPAWFE